jgi:UDP-glucose 6-dehydrogenase
VVESGRAEFLTEAYKKKIESEIEREEIYSDSLRKVLLKKQKAIGNRYLFAGIGFGAFCYKSIKMAIKFKNLFNESPLKENQTDLDDKRDAWIGIASVSGFYSLILIPIGLTPTEKVASKSTVKYTDAISQSQQNIAELKGYLEAYSEYIRLSII